jgi:hypothetical protein
MNEELTSASHVGSRLSTIFSDLLAPNPLSKIKRPAFENEGPNWIASIPDTMKLSRCLCSIKTAIGPETTEAEHGSVRCINHLMCNGRPKFLLCKAAG